MKTNYLSNLQSLFLLHLKKKIAKYICYFVLNTPDAKYAWSQIFTLVLVHHFLVSLGLLFGNDMNEYER